MILNLKHLNKFKVTCEIFTDSSSHSWGAAFQFCNQTGKNQVTIQNSFGSEHIGLPINTKELLAILFALNSFTHLIRGQGILIHCDNITAIACIKHKGSSHVLRDRISRQIFKLVYQNRASLQITYINTKVNVVPDRLSRKILKSESTEWEIHDSTFHLIKELISCKLDIDLFASAVNHKLKRFASWTPEKDAEIVDSFTIQWIGFIPFINPPFSLWSQILKKLCQDQTELAVGLVPLFPNHPWFTNLLDMLIEIPILMPRNTACIMHLPWDKQKVHPMAPNLRYLLVHLSGKSCQNIPQSLHRFRNRLQNLPGTVQPKRFIIGLLLQ